MQTYTQKETHTLRETKIHYTHLLELGFGGGRSVYGTGNVGEGDGGSEGGMILPLKGKLGLPFSSAEVIFNKNLQVMHQACLNSSCDRLDIRYRIRRDTNCIIFSCDVLSLNAAL